VRLSLVNLYLHGFTEPHIDEYDTLTSEEKWNEQADIILANPPFMSPKGGIKPHKRFSVQAKRAEVLFVDYIAEHLMPTGRAAVIVPEGIIFQSGKAYKQLRKNLVETAGLVAVVSLPAGVFQPYSGVKTSILILDRRLAKQHDDILFVKIANDGFGLGAQRREVPGEQLTEAKQVLWEFFRQDLQDGQDWGKLAHVVQKEKIAENGEYNLSGERYKIVKAISSDYPIVELGKVCEVSAGNSAPQNKALFEDGKYPFCRTSDVGAVHLSTNLTEIRDWLNDEGVQGLRLYEKGTILFPKSGASTFLNHRVILGMDGYVSSHLATIIPDPKQVVGLYVFHLLAEIDAKGLTNDQAYPSLKLSQIKSIKIPLPPLSVQEELVLEIEGYQKIIENKKREIAEEEKKIQQTIARVWREDAMKEESSV